MEGQYKSFKKETRESLDNPGFCVTNYHKHFYLVLVFHQTIPSDDNLMFNREEY